MNNVKSKQHLLRSTMEISLSFTRSMYQRKNSTRRSVWTLNMPSFCVWTNYVVTGSGHVIELSYPGCCGDFESSAATVD